MRKNTILETITAITFLVFVGVILYYSFYPFKVTTLDSIGIDAAEYCRGDWVEVDMQFTKHMDVEAQVTWYIVDGIVYELDSPGVNRPRGENHIVVSKQIPHSILPGKYNLRVTQEYEVHPLHQTIINTWNTPTFTVLGDEDCSTEEPVIESNQERPVINQSSNPRPGMDTIKPIEPTQQSGQSAQPVQVHQEQAQEQRGEPQVFTSEPEKTPVKDLLETVLKPVKGLL